MNLKQLWYIFVKFLVLLIIIIIPLTICIHANIMLHIRATWIVRAPIFIIPYWIICPCPNILPNNNSVSTQPDVGSCWKWTYERICFCIMNWYKGSLKNIRKLIHVNFADKKFGIHTEEWIQETTQWRGRSCCIFLTNQNILCLLHWF